jgi:aminoglycoside phosphotransferase (APT) family kinase protein
VGQPAAEVELTAADVDRMLAAQHPALRGALRLVANGWDNEVFRLGDDLAVRLPRRQAAAVLIEHEQRWLPELAGRLPLPVPLPVAVGVATADYPWRWSVVPWFEGRPALAASPSTRDGFAEPLADFLQALHTPAPADAPANEVRGVSLASRSAAVTARLTNAPDLQALWNDALAAPEWDRAAVWVHGDVHPGNLVIDDLGRLPAVIDFGDLCGGDPACDLSIAWTGFTAAGRDAFRARLGDAYDDATWRRARG